MGKASDTRPAQGASPRSELCQRLANGPPLLLDGATGTELEHRGARTGLPLWSTHALLDAPALLRAIHEDYALAGAEILTANTFRTQRRALARGRALDPTLGAIEERDRALSLRAVALAREAARSAAQRVFVAGSAPPLEDCYRPDRVPDERALVAEHRRHAENLAEAGVDLVLIETMNCAREARAALRAADEVGLPSFVSFVCGTQARLLSGESLAQTLLLLEAEEPLAVLVNCLPPSAVAACLGPLADSGRPFGVYANLGEPEDERGFRRSEDCAAEEFATQAASWVLAGARIVGGCCGTTPEHIAATARRLSGTGR